jgi:hypothetical protein
MTEKKTVLSSEKVAIRIAEIKENRYISYYNVLIKTDCIAIVLLFVLLISGFFTYEEPYYNRFSYGIKHGIESSFYYILSYLVSSTILLFIFKSIHKEVINSLKDLKEETENLENRINTSNNSDNRKMVICGLDRLNEVDKEMIKKLINISDFPVIEGEEDLRYISTKDKKEENKDLLKYLTNNQALLESIGITKVTNYYDIAVVYKIDKFVMNHLK